MRSTRHLAFLTGLAALALGGCLSSSPSSVADPPRSAGPRPLVGWLAGPAGEPLEAADRERAYAAQITAAETGQRASWRSVKGHFGFVEPAAEASGAGGACRAFSHTIYIDGRVQRGGGSACRGAGGWDVVS
jgi:surface antigen